MIDLRPVFFICGILLVTLAMVMAIPAIIDRIVGNPDWQAFAISALLTLFAGGLMILTNRGRPGALSIRQAFVLTTASWASIAAFGALPFTFAELGMGYTDAFFEAMSGITTTGSTVMSGLDAAPPGILLWRALLQWLGGIGIIVVAVAILPLLSVGGMQLFRVEAFDTPEKVMPRAAQIAAGIGFFYVGASFVFVLLFWAAGMAPFDAVAHTFAGIATGGFSTKDASIGFYQSDLIDWIMVLCMITGSLPFVYYLDLVRGKWRPMVFDSQVRTFLGIASFGVLAVGAWLWLVDKIEPFESLTQSVFNVISMLTGTGFTTEDFNQWGGLPVILLFTFMFIGGCAGSTTCGIKIFRFQLAYAVARTQVARLMQPHGVFIPYYNRRPISDDVALSVMGFFFLFVTTFAVLAFVLGTMGLDFLTALSGAATVISNVGPAFGEIIGPTGNFSSLPDGAKWVMSAGMLLGRLELFTVFVLFVPSFWRG